MWRDLQREFQPNLSQMYDALLIGVLSSMCYFAAVQEVSQRRRCEIHVQRNDSTQRTGVLRVRSEPSYAALCDAGCPWLLIRVVSAVCP